MLSKKVLKDIQSLGLKKYRQQSGLFLAEGSKMVAELIQLIPDKVVAVYATEEWAQKNSSVTVQVVTPAELERISGLKTPNEVVAVLQQFTHAEPSIRKGWSLYLDCIQDPGNFGTIIRIADWFGIEHIVCSEGCAELYNPKVVQSTMASIARTRVWYDDEGQWLSKQSLPVLAATLKGTSVYKQQKIRDGILVIGNESKGISEEVLKLATNRVTIPRIGEAESLNAAVATGILLSHLI